MLCRIKSTVHSNTTVVDGSSVPKKYRNDTDDKDTFITENGYVIVFTDGACENNGKPNAKAGIGVWFGDNHQL